MTEPAFRLHGERFVPSACASSGWSETLVHGAPAAGLLARAVERFAADPEMRLVRLTTDLLRPVPLEPLQVVTTTRRQGKRIHVVEASLLAGETEAAHAVGLVLHASDEQGPELTEIPLNPPGPESDVATPLIMPSSGTRPASFSDCIERRRVPLPGDSDTLATWIRLTEPLVEGEEWSPLSRAVATCDLLNGSGSFGRFSPYKSINADNTTYFHRDPHGEWICMQTGRVLTPTGVGIARATLYDVDSIFGASIQALLKNE
jgi:hypothetical protein